MRTVKSNAKRQNVGLTIPVATQQARKIVDRVMPGAGATVESRGSALADLTPVIVTTVTFPADTHAAQLLSVQLVALGGSQRVADSSIVITRTR